MPNYDYECKNCGHELTIFQNIKESKKVDCPKCLEKSLKRLVGGKNATLQFQGSGYYIKDYATKAPQDKTDK